jgi:hypothetical protein
MLVHGHYSSKAVRRPAGLWQSNNTSRHYGCFRHRCGPSRHRTRRSQDHSLKPPPTYEVAIIEGRVSNYCEAAEKYSKVGEGRKLRMLRVTEVVLAGRTWYRTAMIFRYLRQSWWRRCVSAMSGVRQSWMRKGNCFLQDVSMAAVSCYFSGRLTCRS